MEHPSKIERIKEFDFDCAKAHIYFLVKSDEVIYVGKSTSFLGRYMSHKKTEKCYKLWEDGKVTGVEGHLKDFDKCYILEVHEDNLDREEQHYIQLYLPKYNICATSVKLREKLKAEEIVIKKFIIDNQINQDIERKGSKWLIQVK